MNHFFCEVLFFLIFLPKFCFASIELTISNLESKDDYYSVDAVVTGMSSSSATFIQGMFTKSDTTKYFGYTLSKKAEWLAYTSSPEKSFVLENYLELQNNISQKIYIKPNYSDLDYLGPGSYVLKLKRYTASGSPSDYSNSLELSLNHSLTTTPSPTPTPSPTSTPTISSATTLSLQVTKLPQTQVTPPTSNPTKTSTLAISKTTPSTISASPTLVSQVLATASSVLSTEFQNVIPEKAEIDQIDVATESTISSSIKLSDKSLFLAGITVFSFSGGLLYFRLKNL